MEIIKDKDNKVHYIPVSKTIYLRFILKIKLIGRFKNIVPG